MGTVAGFFILVHWPGRAGLGVCKNEDGDDGEVEEEKEEEVGGLLL